MAFPDLPTCPTCNNVALVAFSCRSCHRDGCKQCWKRSKNTCPWCEHWSHIDTRRAVGLGIRLHFTDTGQPRAFHALLGLMKAMEVVDNRNLKAGAALLVGSLSLVAVWKRLAGI